MEVKSTHERSHPPAISLCRSGGVSEPSWLSTRFLCCTVTCTAQNRKTAQLAVHDQTTDQNAASCTLTATRAKGEGMHNKQLSSCFSPAVPHPCPCRRPTLLAALTVTWLGHPACGLLPRPPSRSCSCPLLHRSAAASAVRPPAPSEPSHGCMGDTPSKSAGRRESSVSRKAVSATKRN